MIIGINKPKGITSHDVINQIRKITRVKRVGHAGTLDPAASGVLVIAIGRESTKQLGEIVEHDKEYVATIKLGETSDTDDGEGKIIPSDWSLVPSKDEVLNQAEKFVGEIEQVPPMYSAIKKSGKKLYDLARKGIILKLEPRNVEITSIKVIDYKWPTLKLAVCCGKGVYIRSLARDLGEALHTGGYLSGLIRTRVGKYRIEDAKTIDQFMIEWEANS